MSSLSEGFKFDVKGISQGLPMATLGTLAGINPSAFVSQGGDGNSFVKGMAAVQTALAPLSQTLKENFDPVEKRKRALALLKMDQEEKLMPLQTENEIAQQTAISNAYKGLTNGVEVGASGNLQATAQAIADREKIIKEGSRTKDEATAEKLRLDKAALELQNSKDLNDEQKKVALQKLQVDTAQNNAILDAYKNEAAANSGMASTPLTPTSKPEVVKEDPYLGLGKPPAATLTKFDPVTGKFKEVKNTEYDIWNAKYEAAIKGKSETDKEAAKKVADKEALEPLLKERAARSIETIKDIKGLIGGWSTVGTIGNLRNAIPFSVNDAKILRAKIGALKSQLSTSELLKMKAAGVSFGALSDSELGLLGASIDAIDPNTLSADQLTGAMNKINKSMEKVLGIASAEGDGNKTEKHLNVGESKEHEGITITRTK